MNNPIESARGYLPTKEKVLPKEQLNQSAHDLINEFKTTLSMLGEFQAVSPDDFFTGFRFPVDISFKKISFNRGKVEYTVLYGRGHSLVVPANKESLIVSKADGEVFSRIELESRTPLRKLFPGGAGVRYYWGPAEIKYLRGIYGPTRYYDQARKERNTPLALGKAREMLAELTPQK